MDSKLEKIVRRLLAAKGSVTSINVEAPMSALEEHLETELGWTWANGELQPPTKPRKDHDCADQVRVGEIAEFRFIDTPKGLRIRAIVEIPCHATTAWDAQEHLIDLHPLREGVRVQLADHADTDQRDPRKDAERAESLADDIDRVLKSKEGTSFLTPVGESCARHQRLPLHDEPCWVCELEAQSVDFDSDDAAALRRLALLAKTDPFRAL
jgi:hypothetical protein